MHQLEREADENFCACDAIENSGNGTEIDDAMLGWRKSFLFLLMSDALVSKLAPIDLECHCGERGRKAQKKAASSADSPAPSFVLEKSMERVILRTDRT